MIDYIDFEDIQKECKIASTKIDALLNLNPVSDEDRAICNRTFDIMYEMIYGHYYNNLHMMECVKKELFQPTSGIEREILISFYQCLSEVCKSYFDMMGIMIIKRYTSLKFISPTKLN